MSQLNDADIESNRLEDYQKCLDTWGERLLERFKPGSHGYHEALHVAYMLSENIECYLLQHPAIVSDPDLYEQVHLLNIELLSVYNKLAQKHENEENT